METKIFYEALRFSILFNYNTIDNNNHNNNNNSNNQIHNKTQIYLQ